MIVIKSVVSSTIRAWQGYYWVQSMCMAIKLHVVLVVVSVVVALATWLACDVVGCMIKMEHNWPNSFAIWIKAHH